MAIDPMAVTNIRLERLGGTGDGLWRVAVGFADDSTKPEGIFANSKEAETLAQELAKAWAVELRVRDQG